MARLAVILAVLLIAFTIFALIDCLRTEESRVRALPRLLWAVLIVIVTPFGGILWLALGKERSGSAPVAATRRSKAPDDDPEFLRRLGSDAQRDERIRDLEARLAELDDDQNNPNDK
ncbi:MAG: PLD nuclease N-terminal domain-containing protein [Actinomycetota bacterium]